MGDSPQCLRDFPVAAHHDAGYQLDKVQRGQLPDDFKPMSTIGRASSRFGYETTRESIA
jgi:phage-related protein